MYPFISSVDEIREANRMLAEVKEELARELPAEGSGESAARMSIETGIMVELPAAVTIIDLLLEEVDFISIGSNDLVQYLLAVDRMNPKVANLYDPYHPAVLRAFRRIVEAARAANKPVSVCGELAGVPEYAPIWIGLGITRLSMSQPAILPLKKHIRNLSAAHCRELTEELFRLRTSEEIRDRVVRFMQSVGDDRISADY
jgi:phosphotransferase system enzyme I (PtsI)